MSEELLNQPGKLEPYEKEELDRHPVEGAKILIEREANLDLAAIVAYVEWGRSGHGRSGTAVAAGVWTDGDFVATTGATTSISAATFPAVAANAWSAEG